MLSVLYAADSKREGGRVREIANEWANEQASKQARVKSSNNPEDNATNSLNVFLNFDISLSQS